MNISGQLLKKIILEEVKKALSEKPETAPPAGAGSDAAGTGVGVGRGVAKAAGVKTDVENAFEIMLNDKKLAPLMSKINDTREKAQLIALLVNQFDDKKDARQALTLALKLISKK